MIEGPTYLNSIASVTHIESSLKILCACICKECAILFFSQTRERSIKSLVEAAAKLSGTLVGINVMIVNPTT